MNPAAQQVITFQSPGGARISLCSDHKDVVTRDREGREHCQVHEGLHPGTCDLCDKGPLPEATS